MVLTAISDPKDFAVLKEVWGKLSKKEKTAVLDSAQGKPLLEEVLKKLTI